MSVCCWRCNGYGWIPGWMPRWIRRLRRCPECKGGGDLK